MQNGSNTLFSLIIAKKVNKSNKKEVKKQIKTHKDTSLSLYPLKSLKKSYAVLN